MQSADTDRADPIVVDLNRMETEAGWILIVDRFGLRATPIWFDWIQWVLALSAVMFFSERIGGITSTVVVGISVMLLWIYFQAIFNRFEFRGLPFVRSAGRSRTISIIISGILAYASWRGALRVAKSVAELMS